MIEKTMKWPLMTGAPLDKWIAPTGAARAVEDAVGLAVAISAIRSKTELQNALNVFQTVRVKRATQMQEASLVNGKLWHFVDGPEQEARDMAMRPKVEGLHFDESPNQWSDPVTQAWYYACDAEEAMAEAMSGALTNTSRPAPNQRGTWINPRF